MRPQLQPVTTLSKRAQEYVDIVQNDPRRMELQHVIKLYKDFARAKPDGYLNVPVFEAMRTSPLSSVVTNFLAGPFAEVRTWLPEMFGRFIARFPDYPHTQVIADNLSDEYGKYMGRHKLELSHAELYRRVLDELKVPIQSGTMSTPKTPKSQAAKRFREWFSDVVNTESPEYLIGHFLAYEITDVLDFPDYDKAVKVIWPGRRDLHEFFSEHADSDHDGTFSRGLQSFYEENQYAMVVAMGNLLDHWTVFYVKASEEVADSKMAS